ncbi:MAG: 5-formyltetrahydrofolate cyclo-ligase [Verrucomicrobiota bacterium]|nr:5-formyltetrahydrofolate cyclo-ligase [Opitutales bacterium]
METPADLKQWRKEQRAMLLARRAASTPAERAAWNEAILGWLESGFPALRGLAVGFCWPYKGEVDPRPLIHQLRAQGSRVALPAVIAKQQPLEFREWWPGAPMKSGALGIPVPEGTPVLVPDAVLVPPVGFCEQGWRLGYGGGYFDLTLAALSPQPLKICIAHELARVPTIHPQPYDVPMDFVVTEAGIQAVETGGLLRVDAAACAQRAARIVAARGLPRRQA